MKTCLFAGTFDPVTKGHFDTIINLNKKYSKVVVGVGVNPKKTPFFSLEERLSFLNEAFKNYPFVEIDYYDGLTVDYMRKKRIKILCRGIRNETDLEYEKHNEKLSKEIYPNLITEYVLAEKGEEKLSSTTVRELIKEKKDYSALLPQGVYELVKKAVEKKKI